MKYWTIQTIEAWEAAQTRGYLMGNPEHYMIPEKYPWMIEQMHKRIANYDGSPPIWLWMVKPDLRQTCHVNTGIKAVRLTVDLDPEDVLISDFDDWHAMLNDSFNADSEEEWDSFYAGKLTITKEQSWERIFDLNRERDSYWHGDSPRHLQGVTGKIPLSRVLKVDHFVGRKQREI